MTPYQTRSKRFAKCTTYNIGDIYLIYVSKDESKNTPALETTYYQRGTGPKTSSPCCRSEK